MPSGQPLAAAMFTVGMRVVLGGGIVGLGPTPACSGNFAASPQAPRRTEIDPMISKFVVIFTGASQNRHKPSQGWNAIRETSVPLGTAAWAAPRIRARSKVRKRAWLSFGLRPKQSTKALVRTLPRRKSLRTPARRAGEHGARQLNFHTASETMRSRPRPLPTSPRRLPMINCP